MLLIKPMTFLGWMGKHPTAVALLSEFDEKRMESEGREVSGIELLRYLVEERRISAAEVSRILGLDRTLGAKIRNGDLRITTDHARKLGAHFKVEPGAFIA